MRSTNVTRLAGFFSFAPAILVVVIGCTEEPPPAPVVPNPAPAPIKAKPSAKRVEMSPDLVP